MRFIRSTIIAKMKRQMKKSLAFEQVKPSGDIRLKADQPGGLRQYACSSGAGLLFLQASRQTPHLRALVLELVPPTPWTDQPFLYNTETDQVLSSQGPVQLWLSLPLPKSNLTPLVTQSSKGCRDPAFLFQGR